MVLIWEYFSDIFFAENLWLPPGVKWTDLTNGPDKTILYPDSKDTLYHIYFTIVLLLVRYTFERYCCEPLGRFIGVKNKKQWPVQSIPLLESAYRKSPQTKDFAAFAKQLDISERQVERWWRLRKQADQPTKLTKFREHAWKATYFSFISIFGFYIMWDKDYFWNLDKCFLEYPHQGVTNDVWWYYTISIAYTWSSMVTVFIDVRRSDFVPMIIHHLLTGALLSISWMTCFYRIGAVLMPAQDSSEIILEVIKAFKLAHYEILCRRLFYIFAFFWFYARIYIYAFHILHSVLIRAPTMLPLYCIGTLLLLMLTLMFLLQIYWSMLILKVIYNYFAYGISEDVRSSGSESAEDCQNSIDLTNDVNGYDVKQASQTQQVYTN